LNDRFSDARLFYLSYGISIAVATAIVLAPGAPLVPILFLSQALNAVLLLAILPFLRALARDRELMGDHRLGRWDSLATAATIALVAISVALLLVLSIA
jgi:Mn2+/Fe2+ NRAMP family transporter